MKKRKALKRHIYITPLPGGNIIILGAAIMLLWAVWEFAIRYEGAVAVWKGQYQYVLDGYITREIMIKNILKVPETKNALLVPAVLALIALFSILTMLFHARWVPAFFIIPLCTMVIFYHTSDSVILRFLNQFESIKLYSGMAIIAGEGMNIVVALKRRFSYNKRLREKERLRLENARRRRPTVHGTGMTLIPEKLPERKRSSRSIGL